MRNPNFHLDETLAAGLIANRLSGAERSRAVRHLLSGCERCREMLGAAFQSSKGVPPGLFEPLIEAGSVLSAVELEMDLIHGELLWRDIERLPQQKRLSFLKRSRAHQTFGVFRSGLAACRKLTQRRPEEAVEMAQLLLTLSEMLDLPGEGHQALRFDWRAAASIALARAKRAVGDFRGARAVLEAAEAFLEMGTQDEVDRAMYYVELGSLLGDIGLFEEAVSTLDKSAALFRFVGDRNNLGKVQLHQALILRSTDISRAFDLAEDGLTKLNLDEETRAEVSAHYTMAYCAAERGETDEAEGIVSTYRYLIEKQEESVRTSFEWLVARIRFRQNRRAEAEQILRGVHQWYLERGFRFEAVLSSIDLAEMMWQDNRPGEALYLLSEVLPILRAWGLHRDSLAVMKKLSESLEQAAIEKEIFATIADQLRRTWFKNGRAGLSGY